jgi:glycosyltransferase involved in cell wall biosynthesis
MLVTCYEQGDFIRECLDSLAAQTFRDTELVVIDDTSRDDTMTVVREWFATTDLDARLIVNEANVGLTACLNLGLAACRGEYVAYCGGDDVWDPDKVERQLAVLEAEGPDTAMAYSDARLIDGDGAALGRTRLGDLGLDQAPAGEVFDLLIATNFIIPSTALYRRSAVDAIGGWDPDLYFEDWDLFLRLADRYRVAAVDAPLISYRVHAQSMSRRTASPMIESRLRLLAKWIGRDAATDAVVYPFLQAQSWRLFKVHPDMARQHVAVAYGRATDVRGRLRHLVATRPLAEAGFEVLRRVTRPFRRT